MPCLFPCDRCVSLDRGTSKKKTWANKLKVHLTNYVQIEPLNNIHIYLSLEINFVCRRVLNKIMIMILIMKCKEERVLGYSMKDNKREKCIIFYVQESHGRIIVCGLDSILRAESGSLSRSRALRRTKESPCGRRETSDVKPKSGDRHPK